MGGSFILITLRRGSSRPPAGYGLRSIKNIGSRSLNAPRQRPCGKMSLKSVAEHKSPLPVVCESVAFCSSIKVSSFAFPVIRLIAAAHSPPGGRRSAGGAADGTKGGRGSRRHVRVPEAGTGGVAQATAETERRRSGDGARTLLESPRCPRTPAHKGEWQEGVSVGPTAGARGGFKGKLQISSM